MIYQAFILIECSVRFLGWLNLLLIRPDIQGCISINDTRWSFRCFVNHMNIGFIPSVVGCLFYLLFYHRIQSLRVEYFLAPNTLINILPNMN